MLARDTTNDVFLLRICLDQGALLASTLIYNSSGSIDEKSVQRLTFIGQLSKVISANQPELEKSAMIGADETVSSVVFPRFIWTLRDFSLKLVGEDGVSSISSDEYMELQLANKTGYDQAILKRNRICRKCMNSIYKTVRANLFASSF